MLELTVILKDSDRTIKQKFPLYDPFEINTFPLHDAINQCITETKKNFLGDPETIQIKIHQEIQ